jgi:hypothetical protein
MRRAVLVLGTTAVGLAALFSFKAHVLAQATPAPSTPPAAPGASGAASSATPQLATPSRTRTITGPVVRTEFGSMQIKLTVTGGRITRVTVVQQTGNGAQSQSDSFAVPKLTR